MEKQKSLISQGGFLDKPISWFNSAQSAFSMSYLSSVLVVAVRALHDNLLGNSLGNSILVFLCLVLFLGGA